MNDRAPPWTTALATARARAWPHLLLLVPLLLAALAYWRVLGGEFQFDDTRTVEGNLAVKDLAGYLSDRLLGHYFGSGRPITDLTFALNYAVGRLEPWNYHLTNLAIHLVAVVLVWRLSLAVLRLAGAARPDWLALAVAGVFALHPLQSQAVSYVSQRAETLASALYVAALLLILRAERRGLGPRAAPALVGAFLVFALALGSKAIAATMPAAWLLLAAAGPGRGRPPGWAGWPRRLAVAAPFLALDAFSAAATLRGLEGQPDAGFSVASLPPWIYLVNQLPAVATYLRLLLWPVGQCVDHDAQLLTSLWHPEPLAAGTLLAGLALGAVASIRWGHRRGGEDGAAARLAGAGVLWWFLLLSVTSSLVPLADVLVEHRTYLASWGIALAAAVGLERLLARAAWSRAAAAAALAVLLLWVALATLLHRRNAVWESQEALWTDAVQKAPAKARAHLNLGFALRARGAYDEAIASYRRGLAVAGGAPAMELQLLRNLSAALLWAGRTEEATEALQRALRLDPQDAEVLVNLAVAWRVRGDLGLAERYARQALAAVPDEGGAWNTLGAVLLDQGDLAGAEQAFRRAVQLDPDVGVRAFNLARVLLRRGEVASACQALGEALRARLDPALRAEVEQQAALRRCPPSR